MDWFGHGFRKNYWEWHVFVGGLDLIGPTSEKALDMEVPRGRNRTVSQ